MKWKLLVSFSPFLMVLLAFLAFVLWNGSVVLGIVSSCLLLLLYFVEYEGSLLLLSLTVYPDIAGAKEAHAVSPHFAQIMYFGLVSALAVAPLDCSLGQIIDLFQSFWKRRPLSFFQVLMAVIVGFFSVHYFRSGQRTS